jgi:uncharacterized phage protein gp47/JayE
MSNSTSVPSVVFGNTGITLPAESDILAGVLADFNAAFGGNLNPDLATPQGQLASSLTAIIGDKNANFAKYVNQVDPDTADGRMQDGIAKIYFITRLPATSTSVAVFCSGLSGTVIPLGALIQDGNGVQYVCTGGGTIGAGGNVTLNFAAVATGPIACAPGAITTIYRAIPGWDSVTNAGAGVIGSNVESRADFEYRRKQSVAGNAVGVLPSIYANVFAVPGVADVYAIENNTSAAITRGSITIPAYSIYVAAVNGTDLAVATAIWQKKPPGAGYAGNTTVNVTDPSGYSIPLPTYAVKFQRPVAQPILFAVQIANTSGLPSDIIAQTQAAILAAFAGADGGPRARIGSTLYASRYYGPVSNIIPGVVEILSLLIGTVTATLPALTVDIGAVPTLTAANISVTLV